MRKLFPLNPAGTLIVDLMAARTPDEFIAESRGAEFDGADGIAVELYDLKPEFRNRESFRRIIDSVQLPFMFIFYRNDRWNNPGPEDEARQELLLEAVEAGAGMIDVMGDLYDRSPDECTRNPEAVAKQTALIERIHSMGAQVVMSSHPQRVMTSDEVVAQLKSFESRGADVVKIVTKADTPDDYAASLRTTMRLRDELKTPFIHLCNGNFGRIQRMAGLSLGVSITFGVHEYHAEYCYNQPTVRAFKAVQNNTHWHISSFFPGKDGKK